MIAYQILRSNASFITSICEKVFNRDCLDYLNNEAFMVHLSEEDALKRIRYLVEKGPRSWKRVFKDVVHKIGF